MDGRCRAAFLFAAVGLGWLDGAHAQEKSSVLDSVKALTLAHRPGDVPVYYSACCTARAIEVQAAFSEALRFYKEKLGIHVDISAAVLDRKDWERAELNTPKEQRTPYGMTHFAGPPFVAFVPADDAGVITQSLLLDKAHATPETLALLQSANLDFDHAASKFILHPALHELGHQLLFAYRIHPPDEPSAAWLYELVASYFAYAYERAQLPATATIVEAVTKMSSGHLTYTALQDFPQAIALMTTGDSSNFIWYQHQFEARVVEVYSHEGLSFLAKVKSAFPAGTKDDLSLAATIDRLDSASPGFKDWAAALADQKASKTGDAATDR